jgi:hypothetical protein
VKNVVGYVAALVTLDLNQDITGIKHSRRFNAFVSAHFDNRFRRDKDLNDLGLKVGIADTRFQAVTNLLFVP